jgi:Na+/proline symporter
MKLSSGDLLTIGLFFAINLGIGLYYARRGSKSLSEFFLSGRSVPWWLAGTSMVATTFAADTPLVVTKLVADNGIAGNWLWWSMAGSGILTVFFFAALWRRSGVLTDVEFIELRYSGKPAAALRGVRAVYQGLIINTIIMGWVNLAIAKIMLVVLGIPKWEAIVICLVLTALYVSIGGLWSVLVTDVLQFIVKMSMIIALAVAAVMAVGGIGELKVKLAVYDLHHHIAGGGSHLDFFPTSNAAYMPLMTFLVYIAVAWWASSYPGSEPGGGGYIAQRIFSSKDEKNAIFATLFFNVAHYALRPWPWILVALASLILYPNGVLNPDTHRIDYELNYVKTMIDYLPVSLRGLMLAGFLSAYMSTIGTQLNLGASYMTNDLYRRFLRPNESQKHYVAFSRIATIGAMIIALVATMYMNSITDAWKYLITFTAGVGLVMILRWYWWRINAWTEISALLASGITATALQFVHVVAPDDPNAVAINLLITVVVTTIVWIIVTFATRPEPMETLTTFYERVRPNPLGWGAVAASSVAKDERQLVVSALDWVAGCALVYFSLFGIGRMVLGQVGWGVLLLVLAAGCLAFILWDLRRRNWETLVVPASSPHRSQGG